jgi:hypothetical protein
MRKAAAVLMSALLGYSLSSWAGTATGTISNLWVRQSDGLAYVHSSATPTGRPPCAQNTAYFMIKDENSVAGKRIFAVLLAAQVSGKRVQITGANTCVPWADGEDIELVVQLD